MDGSIEAEIFHGSSQYWEEKCKEARAEAARIALAAEEWKEHIEKGVVRCNIIMILEEISKGKGPKQ